MINIESAPGSLSEPGSATSSTRTSVEVRIEAAPVRAFAILSLFYLCVVFTLSSFKLLWLDELITLHIAQLPSAAAIWHALAAGADPNPPVAHLLVHYCRLWFGEHEWALRLPDVVGYWIGLLSLFLYLRTRVPATWAIAGTLLSMCMAAFEYSYESRSYGIFYGLAMLAFLCWTRTAADDARFAARQAWLVGMVLALALGISTNYFAVLAFFPVAVGELTRTIMRIIRARRQQAAIGEAPRRPHWMRAVDVRVWLGLVLAGCPLLAYRSLIAHAIAQFAPYAWNKVSLGQVSDSYTEMVEIVLYPILALFALCILLQCVARPFGRLCEACRGQVLPRWFTAIDPRPFSGLNVPAREQAGILTLMAYPLLGYVIASIRGGMLSPRFVIPVCFGFAIAATLLAHQVFRTVPRAGTVFLCFMAAWFICRESYVGYWYEEQKQCFYKVLDHLPEAELAVPPGVPVAIPDPLLALTFQHYAPASLADRAVFPVDFPAIRFYRGDDSPEENLWAGRNLIYTLPIVPLAGFVDHQPEYLIIAGDGNWMLDDLGHHRYPFFHLPIDTRAEAIGGFTPLARGTPAYYVARGEPALDYFVPRDALAIPFHAENELPQQREFHPDGDPQ